MIAENIVDERDRSKKKTDGICRLIKKTMHSKSQKVRIWAIIALGNSGDPRAVRTLIRCCDDRNPEIRLRAVEGLQTLRSGRSLEALIDRLRDTGEVPETRKRAAAALAAIRSFSAIRELRNLHEDPNEEGTLRTFIGRELDRVRLW